MKNIKFQAHIMPHLIAVGIFMLVIIIFFQPQLFGDKEISQHDVFQGRAGGQVITETRNSTGEEVLWLDNMFSGMPGYLVNANYKDYALKMVYNIISLGLPNPAGYVFVCFVCYYIMLLSFGVRPYLAIGGALIFGLTSFNLISVVAGHNSKVHTIAYMPLVIAGIRLTFNNKLLLGFALTSLALALELKANHLQMTYYLLIITVGYGLTELVSNILKGQHKKFTTQLGILFLAAFIGLIANIGRIWTVIEYGQYTIRGKSELKSDVTGAKDSGLDKEYAFRYSNGLMEPLVLFIPNVMGGSSQEELDEDSNLGIAFKSQGFQRAQINQQLRAAPTYWGNQPLTAPYYGGAITLLVFIIGIAFADRKYVIWLVSIAIFGVILTWGKNFETFNYFLFDYLPGYNKFRSVTFAIIIPIFCMPLLGFIGLEKLLSEEVGKDTLKKLYVASGIVAGFVFLLILFAGSFSFQGAIDERLGSLPAWFLTALRDDRLSLLRSDALRTLIFIALGFALIWLSLKKVISVKIMSLAIVLLIGIDMIGVGKRFLSKSSFVRAPYEQFYRATPADNFILQNNQEGKRVLYLPNPFNDARSAYHHALIGGYHGAKLGRYQDIISRSLEAEIQTALSSLRGGIRDFAGLGVLNMLNTGYLIGGSEQNSVIINNSSNGNAWFVGTVKEVGTAEEEITETGQINTKSSAVIDVKKFQYTSKALSVGQIQLEERKPNYLKYKYSNPGTGLAIFSEIFYEKGWNAYIDGEQVDILRANYILRAIETPAGDHEIEFKFSPTSYHVGSTISLISGFLIVLIFIGAAYKALAKPVLIEEGIDD